MAELVLHHSLNLARVFVGSSGRAEIDGSIPPGVAGTVSIITAHISGYPLLGITKTRGKKLKEIVDVVDGVEGIALILLGVECIHLEVEGLAFLGNPTVLVLLCPVQMLMKDLVYQCH